MTKTTVAIDLDSTTVRSSCDREGSSTTRCRAFLRFESVVIELFGTLDQIDDALEQLQIDAACLRAQEEQEQAARNVA